MKINVIYIPKENTLDDVLKSNDIHEVKKAQTKEIFAALYSASLRKSDGTLKSVTDEFMDRIMAL